MPTALADEQRIAVLKSYISDLESQLLKTRAELAYLEESPNDPGTTNTAVQSTELLTASSINHNSSTDDKVRLFLARFRGRTDAFATTWCSTLTGKKRWSPKLKLGSIPTKLRKLTYCRQQTR